MIYTDKVFMSTLCLVFPMEVWDIFMKFHFLHQFASYKGQMCQSVPTAVQWCKAVRNSASYAKFVATLACWKSAEQEDCIHECKLVPPAVMSFDLSWLPIQAFKFAMYSMISFSFAHKFFVFFLTMHNEYKDFFRLYIKRNHMDFTDYTCVRITLGMTTWKE